jgi:competence protein ComEA
MNSVFAGRRGRGGVDLRNPKTVKLLIVLIAIAGIMAVTLINRAGAAEGSEDAIAEGGLPAAADEQGAAVAATTQPATADAGQQASAQATIFVDVAGAVRDPIVAELPAGSRVDDAIKAAGGLAADADMRTVNRATPLNDGDRVYIPAEGEAEAALAVPESAATAAGGTPSAAQGGKVNINTADSDTLQTLNGVGPATAQKIIDHRESHGLFASVDDLTDVSGIGEKTLEKLRPYITV